MTHLWVRAEQRPNEERVGLTPDGAAALVKAGIRVTVERSSVRAIPIDGYIAAGCEIAAENLWPEAPHEAIIFGHALEGIAGADANTLRAFARAVHHQHQGRRLEFEVAIPGHGHEDIAEHQQDGHRQFDPERQLLKRIHSITSPRSRNFARANEPTKPNSAISSAASK